MPKIHFQTYTFRDDGPRKGAGVACERIKPRDITDLNASGFKHEVTCKHCLKLLMAVAKRPGAA